MNLFLKSKYITTTVMFKICSYKKLLNSREYFAYVVQKIKRLAPGFLVFGSLIIIGKAIFSNYVFVDHMNENILEAFYFLLISPAASGAGSLWYVYVLLEF